MKKISIFSLMLAILLLIGCNATKQPVDLVLKNGTIYTENDKSPKAEAVAVKDGKIVFVGTNKEAEKYIGEKTKVNDLQGKTVLPSFIDSHTHPGLVAMTSGNAELAKYQLPTTSKKDTYDYLRKIAKENPKLPYLMI